MSSLSSVDRKTKIMLLNPVGGSGYNDLAAETVIKHKDPNTHVTIASLADRIGGTQTLGYPSIRPLLHAEMIRACLQARKENYDALIVNCFGDPMVDELRQIAGKRMLVLGVRQTAVHTASQLGKRYAVLLPYEMQGSPDPFFRGIVEDTRSAVAHPVVDLVFNNDLKPKDIDSLRNSLAKHGRLAVEQDGADALILGCTMMLGCWRGLQEAVGVPVIDPTVAALRAPTAAAQLNRVFGWGSSAKGKVPTDEELEMVAGSEKSYPFSGRIEIE
ncbi:Asp/Glu/Hydantoin racemase-domain-containing protein [Aspergillus keveii]|uniref:Asp/Glu/Hydantoin racemase-domain-containing protein n=1 Tax=Aspergillus keveii TaxID=714993 RepID=A0ABR4FYD7_9EURO